MTKPTPHSPLHYIVSTNGYGIAVGIQGDAGAAEADAILAHNLYGSNYNDHLFGHLLFLTGVRQFQKFLVMKEYFLIWDEHWTKNRVSGRKDPALDRQFLRRAFKRARIILTSNVTYENFMQNVSINNSSYDIGSHNNGMDGVRQWND